MSCQDNIKTREAADFIFSVLPDEILNKKRKDLFGKETTFKEEFVKSYEEDNFTVTSFSSMEELEKRVFCILEEWLEKGGELETCYFLELFG